MASLSVTTGRVYMIRGSQRTGTLHVENKDLDEALFMLTNNRKHMVKQCPKWHPIRRKPYSVSMVRSTVLYGVKSAAAVWCCVIQPMVNQCTATSLYASAPVTDSSLQPEENQ
jgi:hypothetical protein